MTRIERITTDHLRSSVASVSSVAYSSAFPYTAPIDEPAFRIDFVVAATGHLLTLKPQPQTATHQPRRSDGFNRRAPDSVSRVEEILHGEENFEVATERA